MTHDPKPSLAYDLSRRDFLTVVLATAPAAAVAGRIADWPEAQRDRPVFEHEELFVDDSGNRSRPVEGRRAQADRADRRAVFEYRKSRMTSVVSSPTI